MSTINVLIYLLSNFNKAQEGVAVKSIVLIRLVDSIGWFLHEMSSAIYLDI
ncbi:hypothetical protein [Rickettsia oklahomensis]|uniref:Uncharacterized protein n=1 Tax=Rickettsia oklahomensis TaxID=3141789 RepID=A0AAU7BXM5_9RICK